MHFKADKALTAVFRLTDITERKQAEAALKASSLAVIRTGKR